MVRTVATHHRQNATPIPFASADLEATVAIPATLVQTVMKYQSLVWFAASPLLHRKSTVSNHVTSKAILVVKRVARKVDSIMVVSEDLTTEERKADITAAQPKCAN